MFSYHFSNICPHKLTVPSIMTTLSLQEGENLEISKISCPRLLCTFWGWVKIQITWFCSHMLSYIHLTFYLELLVPRLGSTIILETSTEYMNSFRQNVTCNTNKWAIAWFWKFQDSTGLVRNLITVSPDCLNNY